MSQPVSDRTFYRTVKVDGLSIFYREAGPKDAPVLLLLHGLPSSSRMFEPLFSRLSDRYHLVAPDYPGFGHSDWPDPKTFAYTFDHYAEIMNHFTEALGLPRYTLYMQDYGGPVGFRMALAHPERVQALIVQDAFHLVAGQIVPPRDLLADPRFIRETLLDRGKVFQILEPGDERFPIPLAQRDSPAGLRDGPRPWRIHRYIALRVPIRSTITSPSSIEYIACQSPCRIRNAQACPTNGLKPICAASGLCPAGRHIRRRLCRFDAADWQKPLAARGIQRRHLRAGPC